MILRCMIIIFRINCQKKLNRNYNFEVTVTDGNTYVTRSFNLFVVGDDFATADNIIIKAADGVFTADITSTRAPIWLTNAALGSKRADNYITIYLENVGFANYFRRNILFSGSI